MKLELKNIGFVKKKTYHKLKEQLKTTLELLKKAGIGNLTSHEKEKIRELELWLESIKDKEEAELGSDLGKDSEWIKNELDELQEKLRVAYDNIKAQTILKEEAEAGQKQAEENQKIIETKLVAEREKVARLEAELAAEQAEQNSRPTSQELREVEEELDAARDEKDQLQQKLNKLQADLEEKDESLNNLVKERDSRPTQQQLEQIQKKLDKIKGEAKKWKDKYNNSELEKKYNELLKELLDLKGNNNKLKEEYEKDLEGLKAQANNPNSDLEEKQKEIDLLQKVSETLEKENQVLKEVIGSLKSGNPQEEQVEKKQQIVEVLEERLVDCCRECLIEKEGQEEGLNEAKKEIFQLCKRLDVTLPEWLEKKIENSVTYGQLIKNLSDIHDRKTITEIQERAEKTGQVVEETFTTTELHKEIKPGVKQFFWITGILALISSILAIVKKWRSSKLRKK